MSEQTKIVKIECGRLEGVRPRKAGSNARLGEHGIHVRPRFARITLNDDSTGFGSCHAPEETLRTFLGIPLEELYSDDVGVLERGIPLEYPLWDLAGQRVGKPVYALAAAVRGKSVEGPLHAPCYDTSLYFDDLHLSSTEEAAELLAGEAREGYDRGHRAFKLKVGRGARHLPLEEGTRRDIAIVRKVREAVGPDCPIMLDANNGYNLNLTKRVLEETADCGVFWMEEAFHEDPVLYRDLREWLDERNLPVLIADGEGEASPRLLDWAREGLIQVVQYDIFHPGFARWLNIGAQLDEWGVRSAPHHYGGHYGNYASCHLQGAITGFTYVEWDEVSTPGLDGSAYRLEEGRVHVPDAPGFGLGLDEAAFEEAVRSNGFVLTR